MSNLKNRMFKRLLIKKRILNKLKPRERNDFVNNINQYIYYILLSLFYSS